MKKTLYKNIYNHIYINSLIITDELSTYKEIQSECYWIQKKLIIAKGSILDWR